MRRCFRLFPVYWFSIGLAFAYLCVGGPLPLSVQLTDATTWLANLTLLQAWLHRPNVWGVFWSLHFEVAFYLLSSILFACGLLHRMGARGFAAVLIGFFLACTAKLLRTKNPTDDLYNWMIALSALFGLFAYRYCTGCLSRAVFYSLLGGLWSAVLLIWSVNHALYPSIATSGQLMRGLITGTIGFGAFVFLLEARQRPMPKVLCWLGRRSYPIYLLHPFVLLLLTPGHFPAWALMPCLLSFTLLLAEFAHRFVERPGIAIGRLLDNHRSSNRRGIPTPVPSAKAA